MKPYKGVFTFSCGEKWDIRVQNPNRNHPQALEYSPESIAIKENKGAASLAKAEKKEAAYKKRLDNFRNSAKVGTRVRVYVDTFQAWGTVVESRGDTVNVQFTEKIIDFKRTSILPIEKWLHRSYLLFPDEVN